MNVRSKRVVLVCLLTALIALLLLSASLSGLELQPGAPIPGAGEPGSPIEQFSVPGAATREPAALPGMILGSLVIGVLVYTLARLAGLVDIRKIAWLVLGVLLLLGLANILPRLAPGAPTLPGEEAPAAAAPPAPEYQTSPLGEAPQAFGWLAAGCLLLGAGALAAYVLRRGPKAVRTQEALAQSAEDALREIAAGKDFRSVIVECYLRMTDVVGAERELQRPREMTAREFQDALESQGLPAEPVRWLTHLFERARYGVDPMSQLDVNTSRECLMQVVEYCRAGAPGGA